MNKKFYYCIIFIKNIFCFGQEHNFLKNEKMVLLMLFDNTIIELKLKKI